MALPDTLRLAVLIDADNASSSVAKELLEEVAKYGTATVKRAYGDWTTQHLTGWKNHLHKHAIQPIQQFAYTHGKNSTDSAFIIDAMDLLYAGNVDGFCIVSSDSDFTRLATRLREAGKRVYGLGERKTPDAFIGACDKFIFFEVLKKPTRNTVPVTIANLPDLREILTLAIEEKARDHGWAALGGSVPIFPKTTLHSMQETMGSQNWGRWFVPRTISKSKKYRMERLLIFTFG